ncbi:hypothetical protein DFH06DRAFT_210890 [Mycena polygramma]|nr:hypothetical protein DFH06DRAFT_210890 [Mycena polygramma]
MPRKRRGRTTAIRPRSAPQLALANATATTAVSQPAALTQPPAIAPVQPSTSAPIQPVTAASQPRPRRRRRLSRWLIPGAGVSTKPTFQRLARRGGVKRLSSFMYEESRGCFFPYVRELLRDTILHAENGYRTTVTAADVVHALRRSGRNLYGYGG